MKRLIAAAMALAATGCLRGVPALRGTPTVVSLPPVELPRRPMQLQFTWVYGDDAFSANGDGVVRVAPPARARLDFFLRNGSAGGFAILDGDSLYVPGAAVAERLMPPAPMLWAALHRLALPATRDTVARTDGDSLRIDMGTFRSGDARSADGRAWRLTFGGKRLARVDRIEKGRIIESMVREHGTNGERIRYYHEEAHRRLTIVLADTTWVEGFDAAIWRRP